jgi:cytochrome c oxidase subunit 2
VHFGRPNFTRTRAAVLRALVACTVATAVPNAVAFSTRARAPQNPEPRVIEITAKRYAFEPAVVEVTQGEPIRLLVRSADGPHGIAIKELKIDKEVERGPDPVKIEFTAKDVGEFQMLCTVICGEGHLTMTGKLVVVARRQEAP